MELKKINNIFIFECNYSQKEIPKKAGFWWHPSVSQCDRKNCKACQNRINRQWWTADIDKALRLIQYSQGDTLSFLDKIKQ